MAGRDLAIADRSADEIAVAAFCREINHGRRTVRRTDDIAQIDGASEMAAVRPDHDQHVAILGGTNTRHL